MYVNNINEILTPVLTDNRSIEDMNREKRIRERNVFSMNREIAYYEKMNKDQPVIKFNLNDLQK